MKAKGPERETQLVVFTLGQEEFAVGIAEVREVLQVPPLLPPPLPLDCVEGVIHLRGEAIPVIDLRKRFGLPGAAPAGQSRIIIAETESRPVGLLVDTVREVVRLPDRHIQEAPGQVAGIRAGLVLGVANLEDRLLVILRMKKLLTAGEQAASTMQEVAATAEEPRAGAGRLLQN